jgi:hypothetical protein
VGVPQRLTTTSAGPNRFAVGPAIQDVRLLMLELITPCLLLIHPVSNAEPQAVSHDLKFAIRLSKTAAKMDLDSLKSVAHGSVDPMERLISAYLLFKIDPISNKDLFTKSFPTSRVGVSRFLDLYSSIPYSEKEGGNEYRHPKANWSIGFWSIYNAYLERVKAGDSVALRHFLQLDGHGDGEVGEGIASDISELFQRPKFALAHWQVLEPHKEYLRSIKGWASDEGFNKIRREYSELLRPNDPRRAIILELLDTPE